MSFPVSPAVQVNEFDFTTIVPEVATSTGALAGVFRWGPMFQRVLIDQETSGSNLFGRTILTSRFGTPSNFNAETWFTVANFLAYGAPAQVVRTGNTTSVNTSIGCLTAFANAAPLGANVLTLIVKNENDWHTKQGTFDPNVPAIAKWPGAIGNSLRLSVCYDANSYHEVINLASFGTGATFSSNIGSNAASIVITANSITAANTAALNLFDMIQETDIIEVGNTLIGQQFLFVSNVAYTPGSDSSGNTTTGSATVHLQFTDIMKLHTDYSSNTELERFWEHYSIFDGPPGQSSYQSQFGNVAAQDELHAVVTDDGGQFSGVPGQVLEVYGFLSRATDSVSLNGGTNYYQQVINDQSQFVWITNDSASALSNTAANLASASTTEIVDLTFSGGSDGASEANVSVAMIASGYDLFRSPEDVDVSLVMSGKARGGVDGTQVPNYIMDNIAEIRKDCVVFVSPNRSDVVNVPGQELDNLILFVQNLRNTSYGFMDSGYKYMYDRYNDVNRWVPLNGDMAGLCARTDETHDAWWSPGGYNRGQVKNVIKLAYNPRRSERDILYPADVNPVITDPGQGTILLGDKTLFGHPSAFSRINVRRLFIVLEKAVSTMAKFFLFEFNDSFTRAQFKAIVNPYLRDIKGRRGITDFIVICDDSNNPGTVIDANEFVADLYIKPNRSINFIDLNFNAVGSSIAFSEVIGVTPPLTIT